MGLFSGFHERGSAIRNIYISKPKLYLVSIALKMFSDPNTQTNWAGLFAMTTLSIIPVVVVFMVFKRYLVEGVATTGLKG